jgi:two-component system nitrogen regulation response regulator GlnG/two-component system response regulator HydG
VETINRSSTGQEHRIAHGTLGRPAIALALVWCPSEPARVGEILIVPDGGTDVVFGRGVPSNTDASPRITLHRERPGRLEDTGPLRTTFVSRTQLSLRQLRDGIQVRNVGKRDLEIDGQLANSAVVRVGQTLHVKGQLMFCCVQRTRLPAALMAPVSLHPFGEADALGIVGESAAAWQLRERVAFIGARSPHVLIVGESGTGKELVAQALHTSSHRRRQQLIARNAATFPAGLLDAELFGNVANYPSPGTPDNPGVIGMAHRSTLFLDEIGELPSDLQTHLLRFLDERGEYQRLGEATHRTADVRVIAATNRPVSELQHDFVARLQLRIQVPSLNERIEDVPLLARHVLQKIAARDPAIGVRFLVGWDGMRGEPRISAALIAALLEHRYTTHVRELEALLWCALCSSPGTEIDVSDELSELLDSSSNGEADRTRRDASADEIRSALDRHGGAHDKVWRELGLANRYILPRLMKRYGLAPTGDQAPGPSVAPDP